MTRAIDERRWRREIVDRLEDFTRQFRALERGMSRFGEDFDLPEFKRAFNGSEPDELDAYLDVQAVERSAELVQNYMSELAQAAVKLTGLPVGVMADEGSKPQRAFEALREEGVISAALCKRLVRAHKRRSTIQHAYPRLAAGDVHATIVLVHATAPDFIRGYREWIAPFLLSKS